MSNIKKYTYKNNIVSVGFKYIIKVNKIVIKLSFDETQTMFIILML